VTVAYASTDDVKARLGRDLTSDEQTRFPGLLEEASAIVDGYLGRHYTGEGGIPDAVRIVVSRLIARALTTALPEGMTQQSESAGPYQHSTTYPQGSSNLWLSRSDKLALRSVGGGMASMSFTSERFC
jgi:hypothetical protein